MEKVVTQGKTEMSGDWESCTRGRLGVIRGIEMKSNRNNIEDARVQIIV